MGYLVYGEEVGEGGYRHFKAIVSGFRENALRSLLLSVLFMVILLLIFRFVVPQGEGHSVL